MKNKDKNKIEAKLRRHKRVRAKIYGTSKLPRFSVSRSLHYVYLQLIDDENDKTLLSLHSKKVDSKGKNKTNNAFECGKRLAELAVKAGISKCVFDRGGYIYHGRIKAVAEGARKGGLKF